MKLEKIKELIKKELYSIIQEQSHCNKNNNNNDIDLYSNFFSASQNFKKNSYRDISFFELFSTKYLYDNHKNKLPKFKPYSYILHLSLLRADFDIILKENEKFRTFVNSVILLKKHNFMVNFSFLSALKKLIILLDQEKSEKTDLLYFFGQISSNETNNLEFYFDKIMGFTNKKFPDIYNIMYEIQMEIYKKLFLELTEEKQEVLKFNKRDNIRYNITIDKIKKQKYIIEKLKEREEISTKLLINTFSKNILDNVESNNITENLSEEIISSSLIKKRLDDMLTISIFSKSTVFNNIDETNLFCFILALDLIVSNIENYKSSDTYIKSGILKKSSVSNEVLKKLFIQEQIKKFPKIRFITPLYNKCFSLNPETIDMIINYCSYKNMNDIYPFLEEDYLNYDELNQLFYMSEKYNINSMIDIIEKYNVNFFSIYSEIIYDCFLSYSIDIENDVSSAFISNDLFKNAIKEIKKQIFDKIQNQIQKNIDHENNRKETILLAFIDNL